MNNTKTCMTCNKECISMNQYPYYDNCSVCVQKSFNKNKATNADYAIAIGELLAMRPAFLLKQADAKGIDLSTYLMNPVFVKNEKTVMNLFNKIWTEVIN